MPTWGEILAEVQASAVQRGGQPDFDGIRRRYLRGLFDLTGRPVIVYATNWLRGGNPAAFISLEDMQGMMEVYHGLNGPALDVILHSPGGSAEAVAAIVRYLRHKFSDMRVFVPVAAMSAATMWALAANRVVMGDHSQLGPIDPQIQTPLGQVPARALIAEFDNAKAELAKDPAAITAWLPRLQQYGPGILQLGLESERLAIQLTQEWLRTYMFKGKRDAAGKAKKVARYFADYDRHHSHSLGIDREQARAVGVVVDDLEADQALQDAVLSVFHATMHTFSGPALKIIENHEGKAFVQIGHIQGIPIPIGTPALPPGILVPPGGVPGPAS